MSKITAQVGEAFRLRFKDYLLKPLSWRMIDALATMDENEEARSLERRGDAGESKPDAGKACVDPPGQKDQ